MKLFRDEVHAAQAAQWLGNVRLHRPPSFAMVTGATVAIGAALITFSVWGEVNRKTRLSGLLVPTQGTLNITAPVAGVLTQLPVAEGQTLNAGEILLVLQTEHHSVWQGQMGNTSERVAQQIALRQQSLTTEHALRELQSKQREQVLSDRIHTLQAELRQAEEEYKLQQRRVQLARDTVARNTQLAQEGFVSAAQVQTVEEALIDADGRLQSLERARLALQHDLQSLQGDREALAAQLSADLNIVARNRASLDQESSENAARKSTVITAPSSGTVTALNLKVGHAVQAGQTLVTLVPKPDNLQAPLQAQLFAPSRTAGFLHPGQTVYLRYAAYPYQKFGLHGGKITAISATPFAPSELPPNLSQQLLAQAGSNEALYRINVELDKQDIAVYGDTLPLKAGLTLEADVLQERRKVWEWVLEPVLAARQQLKVLNADPNKVREGG